MTGSAIAAQRLLALDPAEVTVVTFQLSELCEQIAQEATAGLADLLIRCWTRSPSGMTSACVPCSFPER